MINLQNLDLANTYVETLAVLVSSETSFYTNGAINSLIDTARSNDEFPKEKKDVLVLYNPTDKVKRLILVSAGKPESVTIEDLRAITGNIIKRAMKLKLTAIHIAVPESLPLPVDDVLTAMLEGGYLRNYVYDRYKQEKKDKPLEQIVLVSGHDSEQYQQLNQRIKTICDGTIMAREWVTTPANQLTPEIFAREVVHNAEGLNIKITVMDEQELREKNFNTLLAVAAGSQNRPRFVVMEYSPEHSGPVTALIGKAVTFDSGGINLKPSDSLADMKTDMSGGATVAAMIIAAARLNLPYHLVGAIPMVENMPSGSATRPGDIVTSYSGKSVEILNTDAEGRLILADAISYVKDKYAPQLMIDLATLTGACVVALGENIAGIFSPQTALLDKLRSSAERTYERCWPLPLPDDYKEMLKSELADIKNISSKRWGGAITAALFLSEFADMQDWIHIDIAGPAHITKDSAYCPPGGTGFGVRLLLDFLTR